MRRPVAKRVLQEVHDQLHPVAYLQTILSSPGSYSMGSVSSDWLDHWHRSIVWPPVEQPRAGVEIPLTAPLAVAVRLLNGRKAAGPSHRFQSTTSRRRLRLGGATTCLSSVRDVHGGVHGVQLAEFAGVDALDGPLVVLHAAALRSR